MGEKELKEYKAGIDIGSTTVKLVILDENNRMIYGQYKRHMARTQATLAELLSEAQDQLGECRLRVRITGSGAITLVKS